MDFISALDFIKDYLIWAVKILFVTGVVMLTIEFVVAPLDQLLRGKR